MLRTLTLLTALSIAPLASAKADTLLLMAEEPGCYWCAQWTDEIGPIYPKTDIGKTAPLVRYNRRSETPDVQLTGAVRFTPTFILVHDGQEIGRLEGYPGEDFFWGLLKAVFANADIAIEETGNTNDS